MLRLSTIASLATLAVASNVIGVPPDKQHLYNPENGKWRCLLDPSIVLSESQINDNFCDCPDGSDEPGTNACEFTAQTPHYFYCANEGFLPKFIENYKVNDGVCDYDICCDGSDEYLSGKCENKCDKVIEQYTKYIHDKETAISLALQVKDSLVSKAAEIKNALVKKYEKAKLDLNKETKNLEKLTSSLEKAEKEAEEDPARGVMHELSQYNEGVQAIFSKLVASNSDAEQRIAHLENMLADLVQNYNPNFNDLSVKQCVKQYEEYLSNKPVKQEEKPTMDILTKSLSGLFAKLKGLLPVSLVQTVEPSFANMVHHYYEKLISNFKEPIHIETEEPERKYSKSASKLAEQVAAAQKKVNAQKAEFSIYEEYIQRSYGPNDILRSVEGESVVKQIGEYTYKLGFLDSIQQDNTLVGRFAGFDGKSLYYTQGSKCWNGPQRSAVVEVVCGPKNELISVSEPEKCQYKFILESPIACSAVSKEDIAAGFKVDMSKL